MNRVIPCLFSLIIFLSHTSAIHSFEFDPPEGYELADLEEEGIEADEEEKVESDSGPYAKSLFKPSSNEASDSNYAMATLEAGPSAIVAHCVNAVSGDFFDSYTALTVPGPHPLVVQCSYCSSENKWSFLHMPDMEVGFSKGQKHLYARYVDDSGSGMTYRAYANESYPDGIKGRQMTIPSVLFEKGLTNCGSGEISGQTNWRNSQISYVRKKDEKFYMLRHGLHVDRIERQMLEYGMKTHF